MEAAPLPRSKLSWQAAKPELARGAREDQGSVVQHGDRRRPLPLLTELARRSDDPLLSHPRAQLGPIASGQGRSSADRGARASAIAYQEYAALLDEDARGPFQDLLGLSRTVFPYVEEHKFYADYWFLTRFYNKIPRVRRGCWRAPAISPDAEDIFMLSTPLRPGRRSRSWSLMGATGGPPLGPGTTGRRS